MELQKIFDSFNNLKVLILGDVMIDYYVYGKVERISPEAPVPIVNVYKREQRLGGAANVALNVQAMGATPILCSLIGDDANGESYLRIMGENNLQNQGMIKSKHRITTLKKRILAGSQHILRIDSEVDDVINEEEEQMLKNKVDELLEQVNVVIFEDYDKGVLNQSLISYVIEKARSRNIPTVVDPKKRNFFHYQHATLFKPNLKELKEGLKVDFEVTNKEELQKTVKLLKQKLEVEMAMITLSEKGIYIDTDGQFFHLPAHIRSIADVSGAGDTVISIAALCTALKLPPQFIASLSNLGGGLVCEYLGVVPIDKEKLKEEARVNEISRLL